MKFNLKTKRGKHRVTPHSKECDACNGWGWLIETGYGRVRDFDCDKCNGTGRVKTKS